MAAEELDEEAPVATFERGGVAGEHHAIRHFCVAGQGGRPQPIECRGDDAAPRGARDGLDAGGGLGMQGISIAQDLDERPFGNHVAQEGGRRRQPVVAYQIEHRLLVGIRLDPIGQALAQFLPGGKTGHPRTTKTRHKNYLPPRETFDQHFR